MHETCHVIIRIRDPPEPQKVWFYIGKTCIFENLTGPLKVTKMTPKWTQKEPKGTLKAFKRPPKALQRHRRKLHQKNELFRNLS